MKFNFAARVEARKNWHKWFAWYPMCVADNEYRWLETVERRGTYREVYYNEVEWEYEYKAKGETE